MPSATDESDGKRVSLKRADILRLGKLLEELSEEVPGGRAYKLGQGDVSAIKLAKERLQLDIPLDAMPRLRKQLLGPFVTDRGGVKGMVEQLARQVAAMQAQVTRQGQLIGDLQRQLQPQQRQIEQPASRRPSTHMNGSGHQPV